MTGLSTLLRTAADERALSARGVSRRAQELGFTLNHDTAARYLRGDHGRPDEPTLRALAAVLDISLTDLRAAADLPRGQSEPYRPPAEANRLTRRQRNAVDEMIRAMLDPADRAQRRSSRPPGDLNRSGAAAASAGEDSASAGSSLATGWELAARHGAVEDVDASGRTVPAAPADQAGDQAADSTAAKPPAPAPRRRRSTTD